MSHVFPKHTKRNRKHREKRPPLAPARNPISGRKEAALQLPTLPISKFSTASLFSELESSAGAFGVIAQVISEIQQQP